MDRISEFNPCPICGKTDRLWLSDRNMFFRVLKNAGTGSTMVSIGCNRCDIEVHYHTRHSGTHNYDIAVGEVKRKWNSIKR